MHSSLFSVILKQSFITYVIQLSALCVSVITKGVAEDPDLYLWLSWHMKSFVYLHGMVTVSTKLLCAVCLVLAFSHKWEQSIVTN